MTSALHSNINKKVKISSKIQYNHNKKQQNCNQQKNCEIIQNYNIIPTKKLMITLKIHNNIDKKVKNYVQNTFSYRLKSQNVNIVLQITENYPKITIKYRTKKNYKLLHKINFIISAIKSKINSNTLLYRSK